MALESVPGPLDRGGGVEGREDGLSGDHGDRGHPED
jgi:hypothetical protein